MTVGPETELPRWRVELHLDGLATMEQELAMVSHTGVSVTTDVSAKLTVIVYMADAMLPSVPVISAVAVAQHHVPHLQINAVQVTRSLSQREAAAWVKKQFSNLNVSWKRDI